MAARLQLNAEELAMIARLRQELQDDITNRRRELALNAAIRAIGEGRMRQARAARIRTRQEQDAFMRDFDFRLQMLRMPDVPDHDPAAPRPAVARAVPVAAAAAPRPPASRQQQRQADEWFRRQFLEEDFHPRATVASCNALAAALDDAGEGQIAQEVLPDFGAAVVGLRDASPRPPAGAGAQILGWLQAVGRAPSTLFSATEKLRSSVSRRLVGRAGLPGFHGLDVSLANLSAGIPAHPTPQQLEQICLIIAEARELGYLQQANANAAGDPPELDFITAPVNLANAQANVQQALNAVVAVSAAADAAAVASLSFATQALRAAMSAGTSANYRDPLTSAAVSSALLARYRRLDAAVAAHPVDLDVADRAVHDVELALGGSVGVNALSQRALCAAVNAAHDKHGEDLLRGGDAAEVIPPAYLTTNARYAALAAAIISDAHAADLVVDIAGYVNVIGGAVAPGVHALQYPQVGLMAHVLRVAHGRANPLTMAQLGFALNDIITNYPVAGVAAPTLAGRAAAVAALEDEQLIALVKTAEDLQQLQAEVPGFVAPAAPNYLSDDVRALIGVYPALYDACQGGWGVANAVRVPAVVGDIPPQRARLIIVAAVRALGGPVAARAILNDRALGLPCLVTLLRKISESIQQDHPDDDTPAQNDILNGLAQMFIEHPSVDIQQILNTLPDDAAKDIIYNYVGIVIDRVAGITLNARKRGIFAVGLRDGGAVLNTMQSAAVMDRFVALLGGGAGARAIFDELEANHLLEIGRLIGAAMAAGGRDAADDADLTAGLVYLVQNKYEAAGAEIPGVFLEAPNPTDALLDAVVRVVGSGDRRGARLFLRYKHLNPAVSLGDALAAARAVAANFRPWYGYVRDVGTLGAAIEVAAQVQGLADDPAAVPPGQEALDAALATYVLDLMGAADAPDYVAAGADDANSAAAPATYLTRVQFGELCRLYQAQYNGTTLADAGRAVAEVIALGGGAAFAADNMAQVKEMVRIGGMAQNRAGGVAGNLPFGLDDIDVLCQAGVDVVYGKAILNFPHRNYTPNPGDANEVDILYLYGGYAREFARLNSIDGGGPLGLGRFTDLNNAMNDIFRVFGGGAQGMLGIVNFANDGGNVLAIIQAAARANAGGAHAQLIDGQDSEFLDQAAVTALYTALYNQLGFDGGANPAPAYVGPASGNVAPTDFAMFCARLQQQVVNGGHAPLTREQLRNAVDDAIRAIGVDNFNALRAQRLAVFDALGAHIVANAGAWELAAGAAGVDLGGGQPTNILVQGAVDAVRALLANVHQQARRDAYVAAAVADAEQRLDVNANGYFDQLSRPFVQGYDAAAASAATPRNVADAILDLTRLFGGKNIVELMLANANIHPVLEGCARQAGGAQAAAVGAQANPGINILPTGNATVFLGQNAINAAYHEFVDAIRGAMGGAVNFPAYVGPMGAAPVAGHLTENDFAMLCIALNRGYQHSGGQTLTLEEMGYLTHRAIMALGGPGEVARRLAGDGVETLGIFEEAGRLEGRLDRGNVVVAAGHPQLHANVDRDLQTRYMEAEAIAVVEVLVPRAVAVEDLRRRMQGQRIPRAVFARMCREFARAYADAATAAVAGGAAIAQRTLTVEQQGRFMGSLIGILGGVRVVKALYDADPTQFMTAVQNAGTAQGAVGVGAPVALAEGAQESLFRRLGQVVQDAHNVPGVPGTINEQQLGLMCAAINRAYAEEGRDPLSFADQGRLAELIIDALGGPDQVAAWLGGANGSEQVAQAMYDIALEQARANWLQRRGGLAPGARSSVEVAFGRALHVAHPVDVFPPPPAALSDDQARLIWVMAAEAQRGWVAAGGAQLTLQDQSALVSAIVRQFGNDDDALRALAVAYAADRDGFVTAMNAVGRAQQPHVVGGDLDDDAIAPLCVHLGRGFNAVARVANFAAPMRYEQLGRMILRMRAGWRAAGAAADPTFAEQSQIIDAIIRGFGGAAQAAYLYAADADEFLAAVEAAAQAQQPAGVPAAGVGLDAAALNPLYERTGNILQTANPVVGFPGAPGQVERQMLGRMAAQAQRGWLDIADGVEVGPLTLQQQSELLATIIRTAGGYDEILNLYNGHEDEFIDVVRAVAQEQHADAAVNNLNDAAQGNLYRYIGRRVYAAQPVEGFPAPLAALTADQERLIGVMAAQAQRGWVAAAEAAAAAGGPPAQALTLQQQSYLLAAIIRQFGDVETAMAAYNADRNAFANAMSQVGYEQHPTVLGGGGDLDDGAAEKLYASLGRGLNAAHPVAGFNVPPMTDKQLGAMDMAFRNGRQAGWGALALVQRAEFMQAIIHEAGGAGMIAHWYTADADGFLRDVGVIAAQHGNVDPVVDVGLNPAGLRNLRDALGTKINQAQATGINDETAGALGAGLNLGLVTGGAAATLDFAQLAAAIIPVESQVPAAQLNTMGGNALRAVGERIGRAMAAAGRQVPAPADIAAGMAGLVGNYEAAGDALPAYPYPEWLVDAVAARLDELHHGGPGAAHGAALPAGFEPAGANPANLQANRRAFARLCLLYKQHNNLANLNAARQAVVGIFAIVQQLDDDDLRHLVEYTAQAAQAAGNLIADDADLTVGARGLIAQHYDAANTNLNPPIFPAAGFDIPEWFLDGAAARLDELAVAAGAAAAVPAGFEPAGANPANLQANRRAFARLCLIYKQANANASLDEARQTVGTAIFDALGGPAAASALPANQLVELVNHVVAAAGAAQPTPIHIRAGLGQLIVNHYVAAGHNLPDALYNNGDIANDLLDAAYHHLGGAVPAGFAPGGAGPNLEFARLCLIYKQNCAAPGVDFNDARLRVIAILAALGNPAVDAQLFAELRNLVEVAAAAGDLQQGLAAFMQNHVNANTPLNNAVYNNGNIADGLLDAAYHHLGGAVPAGFEPHVGNGAANQRAFARLCLIYKQHSAYVDLPGARDAVNRIFVALGGADAAAQYPIAELRELVLLVAQNAGAVALDDDHIRDGLRDLIQNHYEGAGVNLLDATIENLTPSLLDAVTARLAAAAGGLNHPRPEAFAPATFDHDQAFAKLCLVYKQHNDQASLADASQAVVVLFDALGNAATAGNIFDEDEDVFVAAVQAMADRAADAAAGGGAHAAPDADDQLAAVQHIIDNVYSVAGAPQLPAAARNSVRVQEAVCIAAGVPAAAAGTIAPPLIGGQLPAAMTLQEYAQLVVNYKTTAAGANLTMQQAGQQIQAIYTALGADNAYPVVDAAGLSDLALAVVYPNVDLNGQAVVADIAAALGVQAALTDEQVHALLARRFTVHYDRHNTGVGVAALNPGQAEQAVREIIDDVLGGANNLPGLGIRPQELEGILNWVAYAQVHGPDQHVFPAPGLAQHCIGAGAFLNDAAAHYVFMTIAAQAGVNNTNQELNWAVNDIIRRAYHGVAEIQRRRITGHQIATAIRTAQQLFAANPGMAPAAPYRYFPQALAEQATGLNEFTAAYANIDGANAAHALEAIQDAAGGTMDMAAVTAMLGQHGGREKLLYRIRLAAWLQRGLGAAQAAQPSANFLDSRVIACLGTLDRWAAVYRAENQVTPEESYLAVDNVVVELVAGGMDVADVYNDAGQQGANQLDAMIRLAARLQRASGQIAVVPGEIVPDVRAIIRAHHGWADHYVGAHLAATRLEAVYAVNDLVDHLVFARVHGMLQNAAGVQEMNELVDLVGHLQRAYLAAGGDAAARPNYLAAEVKTILDNAADLRAACADGHADAGVGGAAPSADDSAKVIADTVEALGVAAVRRMIDAANQPSGMQELRTYVRAAARLQAAYAAVPGAVAAVVPHYLAADVITCLGNFNDLQQWYVQAARAAGAVAPAPSAEEQILAVADIVAGAGVANFVVLPLAEKQARVEIFARLQALYMATAGAVAPQAGHGLSNAILQHVLGHLGVWGQAYLAVHGAATPEQAVYAVADTIEAMGVANVIDWVQGNNGGSLAEVTTAMALAGRLQAWHLANGGAPAAAPHYLTAEVRAIMGAYYRLYAAYQEDAVVTPDQTAQALGDIILAKGGVVDVEAMLAQPNGIDQLEMLVRNAARLQNGLGRAPVPDAAAGYQFLDQTVTDRIRNEHLDFVAWYREAYQTADPAHNAVDVVNAVNGLNALMQQIGLAQFLGLVQNDQRGLIEATARLQAKYINGGAANPAPDHLSPELLQHISANLQRWIALYPPAPAAVAGAAPLVVPRQLRKYHAVADAIEAMGVANVIDWVQGNNGGSLAEVTTAMALAGRLQYWHLANGGAAAAAPNYLTDEVRAIMGAYHQLREAYLAMVVPPLVAPNDDELAQIILDTVEALGIAEVTRMTGAPQLAGIEELQAYVKAAARLQLAHVAAGGAAAIAPHYLAADVITCLQYFNAWQQWYVQAAQAAQAAGAVAPAPSAEDQILAVADVVAGTGVADFVALPPAEKQARVEIFARLQTLYMATAGAVAPQAGHGLSNAILQHVLGHLGVWEPAYIAAHAAAIAGGPVAAATPEQAVYAVADTIEAMGITNVIDWVQGNNGGSLAEVTAAMRLAGRLQAWHLANGGAAAAAPNYLTAEVRVIMGVYHQLYAAYHAAHPAATADQIAQALGDIILARGGVVQVAQLLGQANGPAQLLTQVTNAGHLQAALAAPVPAPVAPYQFLAQTVIDQIQHGQQNFVGWYQAIHQTATPAQAQQAVDEIVAAIGAQRFFALEAGRQQAIIKTVAKLQEQHLANGGTATGQHYLTDAIRQELINQVIYQGIDIYIGEHPDATPSDAAKALIAIIDKVLGGVEEVDGRLSAESNEIRAIIRVAARLQRQHLGAVPPGQADANDYLTPEVLALLRLYQTEPAVLPNPAVDGFINIFRAAIIPNPNVIQATDAVTDLIVALGVKKVTEILAGPHGRDNFNYILRVAARLQRDTQNLTAAVANRYLSPDVVLVMGWVPDLVTAYIDAHPAVSYQDALQVVANVISARQNLGGLSTRSAAQQQAFQQELRQAVSAVPVTQARGASSRVRGRPPERAVEPFADPEKSKRKRYKNLTEAGEKIDDDTAKAEGMVSGSSPTKRFQRRIAEHAEPAVALLRAQAALPTAAGGAATKGLSGVKIQSIHKLAQEHARLQRIAQAPGATREQKNAATLAAAQVAAARELREHLNEILTAYVAAYNMNGDGLGALTRQQLATLNALGGDIQRIAGMLLVLDGKVEPVDGKKRIYAEPKYDIALGENTLRPKIPTAKDFEKFAPVVQRVAEAFPNPGADEAPDAKEEPLAALVHAQREIHACIKDLEATTKGLVATGFSAERLDANARVLRSPRPVVSVHGAEHDPDQAANVSLAMSLAERAASEVGFGVTSVAGVALPAGAAAGDPHAAPPVPHHTNEAIGDTAQGLYAGLCVAARHLNLAAADIPAPNANEGLRDYLHRVLNHNGYPNAAVPGATGPLDIAQKRQIAAIVGNRNGGWLSQMLAESITNDIEANGDGTGSETLRLPYFDADRQWQGRAAEARVRQHALDAAFATLQALPAGTSYEDALPQVIDAVTRRVQEQARFAAEQAAANPPRGKTSEQAAKEAYDTVMGLLHGGLNTTLLPMRLTTRTMRGRLREERAQAEIVAAAGDRDALALSVALRQVIRALPILGHPSHPHSILNAAMVAVAGQPVTTKVKVLQCAGGCSIAQIKDKLNARGQKDAIARVDAYVAAAEALNIEPNFEHAAHAALGVEVQVGGQTLSPAKRIRTSTENTIVSALKAAVVREKSGQRLVVNGLTRVASNTGDLEQNLKTALRNAGLADLANAGLAGVSSLIYKYYSKRDQVPDPDDGESEVVLEGKKVQLDNATLGVMFWKQAEERASELFSIALGAEQAACLRKDADVAAEQAKPLLDRLREMGITLTAVEMSTLTQLEQHENNKDTIANMRKHVADYWKIVKDEKLDEYGAFLGTEGDYQATLQQRNALRTGIDAKIGDKNYYTQGWTPWWLGGNYIEVKKDAGGKITELQFMRGLVCQLFGRSSGSMDDMVRTLILHNGTKGPFYIEGGSWQERMELWRAYRRAGVTNVVFRDTVRPSFTDIVKMPFKRALGLVGGTLKGSLGLLAKTVGTPFGQRKKWGNWGFLSDDSHTADPLRDVVSIVTGDKFARSGEVSYLKGSEQKKKSLSKEVRRILNTSLGKPTAEVLAEVQAEITKVRGKKMGWMTASGGVGQDEKDDIAKEYLSELNQATSGMQRRRGQRPSPAVMESARRAAMAIYATGMSRVAFKRYCDSLVPPPSGVFYAALALNLQNRALGGGRLVDDFIVDTARARAEAAPCRAEADQGLFGAGAQTVRPIRG